MSRDVLLRTSIAKFPVRRGKVRDVYDLGDRLLLVSTDRISAFDWILPTGIPDKGRVLTQLSAFWFRYLGEAGQVISTDASSITRLDAAERQQLAGRSMLVRKTTVIPIECVVRGYLAGSGWKDYQRSGAICGITLPAGMQESQKLDQPIFTPTTKEEHGHDQSISYERMCELVGDATARELRDRSLAVYRKASEYAASRGIIIADTKFEWGRTDEGIILIDEALTPDSSRFWPADSYQVGRGQPSFDKQFVRDWLETTDWDKSSPPPPLPDEVVQQTRAKYIEAYERLTGEKFIAA